MICLLCPIFVYSSLIIHHFIPHYPVTLTGQQFDTVAIENPKGSAGGLDKASVFQPFDDDSRRLPGRTEHAGQKFMRQR